MSIPSIQQQAFKAAQAHQAALAVPVGELGRLGDMACWFAARQGKEIPDDLKAVIVLFAADHGAAVEVLGEDATRETARQTKCIADGNAAVNLLAKSNHAEIHLVDVGVADDLTDVDGLESARIAAGSKNIASEAAMSQEDYWEAVGIGEDMANKAVAAGANLLVAGDVGPGGYISAATMICHLTGLTPEDVLGDNLLFGNQPDNKAMIAVVEALVRAKNTPSHDILRELGGFDIAAMAGFYRAAAGHGVPVLLDGLVSSAAALAAAAWDVRIAGWMMASHVSASPGHRAALDELGLEPFANLNLGMGQALGAALLLPVLQSAITLHRELPLSGSR